MLTRWPAFGRQRLWCANALSGLLTSVSAIALPRERPRHQRGGVTIRRLFPYLIALTLHPISGNAEELLHWSGRDPGVFTLPNLSLNDVSLVAYRGRPVVVHFFATWCPPCRDEMAGLSRFLARKTTGNLEVLAISVGEPDGRVRRFFETVAVNFPVLLDRDKGVAKSWRVATLPSTYFLNHELQPKLFVRGPLQWDDLDPMQISRRLAEAQ
jgi:peroxiredoxin